jgi:predicted RNA-binding Zn-ribbon protein involved in translation (DUF1610 family)
MAGEVLYMCPSCGVILRKSIWKRRKTHNGLAYSCERCETKHHWDDLRRVII